jgi:glycosyltransferase involved in cell wall biosynthesis
MYRSEALVAEVIESILNQEYGDFGVVAIDDCSPDSTFSVASACSRRDPRIVVESNSARLGMVGNWNRVLERAEELHGEFEYFAWASDNDLRGASWLSVLVRALDENQRAVLACSLFGKLWGDRRDEEPFADSRGISDMTARFRLAVGATSVGPTVYGLLRRSALDQVGGVARVLMPDALLLAHLALHGEVVQEPQVLWHCGRPMTGSSRRRQRASLFASPPVYTFAPVALQHASYLFRWLFFGNRRPPGVGRWHALFLITIYLGGHSRLALGRRYHRVVGKARKGMGTWVKRR